MKFLRIPIPPGAWKTSRFELPIEGMPRVREILFDEGRDAPELHLERSAVCPHLQRVLSSSFLLNTGVKDGHG